MQRQSRSGTYDVCIVGSGAGGGMAAYTLTKAGARVALADRGYLVRNFDKPGPLEGCLRITVGTSEENAALIEALREIA